MSSTADLRQQVPVPQLQTSALDSPRFENEYAV